MFVQLGQRFAIDTNLIDNTSDAVTRLWEYHNGGWIELVKTDVLDTELGDHRNPSKRDRLLDKSSGLVEQWGPAVWGHSRWGHSVLGSDADVADLDLVIAVLFPGADPRDEGAPRSTQRLRDAMHVRTAKRYGLDGFITLDRKDLLSRADAVSAELNGFQILDPERALRFIDRLHARYEFRQRGSSS